MCLLSIITITYNAEAFIDRTMASIEKQTNQDFEYLIIDGLSKDKTLERARGYGRKPDRIVSERDKGLYDAMNKGQNLAQGKYIWFVNAGDEIAESDTVDRLMQLLKVDPDVVYSDTYMVNEEGNVLGLRSEILPHKVPSQLHWKKFAMGMLICHQSFIAKKELAENYMDNNLSADIDWEIQILKKAKKIEQYPGILSRYLIGGVSNQKQFKSWKDRYTVLQKHFGVLPNFWNHLKIVFRSVFN